MNLDAPDVGHPARQPRPRVVIAGGGVAALETLLALRALVGRHVAIDLLAPERELEHRPASVATAFGFGAPDPVDIDAFAVEMGAGVRRAALAGVDTGRSAALLAGGDEVPYDRLVIAVGARPRGVPRGAVRFAGPADAGRLEAVLDRVERGELRRLVFTMAPGIVWTLPLYEIALMAAVELRSRGVRDARLTVATPEREPLWLFGSPAAVAVRGLLAQRDIELRTGVHARAWADGELELAQGERLAADAVIALPTLEGPNLHGLLADQDGFLPVDAHGRVIGAPDVFAAGDATAFPIKQGGLATQQADAVAEAIAVDLGLRTDARPFHPVLRGLLLTGGAPLYLRAELGPAGEVRDRTGTGTLPAAMAGEASSRALWWPPGKIAGRYLAPYLATARPVNVGAAPLADRAASAGEPAPDREDAMELALLMADEDARAGDLRQALHALDAALALSGGVLPEAYAERRAQWRRELTAQ
jgi:sulfide:quinone oxidoreductase